MDGIELEAVFPSNSEDGKMAILDMKVWMDSGHNIVYQHYEKAVASKVLLNAQSAQSAACKRSVHAMEMVRRMLNTSTRLDWVQHVAPVLTDYMMRMKQAGYGEAYRKQTLLKALAIFDKMKAGDENGDRPLHRPRDWNREKGKEEKKKKKRSWSATGGYVAPIFIPATPRGELARQLKDIAEKETEAGLKFKVVEYGGRTVNSEVQKSNPTATPGCDHNDCLACQEGRGKGGPCLKSNIQYELSCNLCSGTDQCLYIGESARNLYTRGREHVEKYQSKKRNSESFIKNHQIEKHHDMPADFSAKVTGNFRDCLTRQISEGVHIRRSEKKVLNTKSEWHQPPLWKVQSEVMRD